MQLAPAVTTRRHEPCGANNINAAYDKRDCLYRAIPEERSITLKKRWLFLNKGAICKAKSEADILALFNERNLCHIATISLLCNMTGIV